MNLFNDPLKIVIENKKVIDYLLNLAHPDGSGKARLFIRYGFHPGNPGDFIKSVIAHAQLSEIVAQFETPFGRKIILQGNLETPSKRKFDD